MERLGFILCVVLITGCAFGSMPDTQTSDFWQQREARMKGW
ncbi:hypothetical protein [Variovorax saccharolyticus]|nr:hypothetical protein [Variovorax sp. J31P216]MDM0027771.1 hypothetical protein [Variovorax sp. J31P216]